MLLFVRLCLFFDAVGWAMGKADIRSIKNSASKPLVNGVNVIGRVPCRGYEEFWPVP